MRLILVRHGESLGNVTQVLQGREDPLTDRGRSQARAIASHLAGRGDVRTIYASPLARALETSQIIGAAAGVEPQPIENLAELNVGHAAGMRFTDWMSAHPEEAARFHADGAGYTFPGGESGRQLGARVAAAMDRIVAAHHDDPHPVVVVSHGGALAWILAHLLRETDDNWPSYEFHNCSFTEVIVEGDQATLICRNEIGHLSVVAEEEVATGRV